MVCSFELVITLIWTLFKHNRSIPCGSVVSAESNVRLGNIARRALFALNAAQRVAKAVIGGKGVKEAVGSERAFFEVHKQASKNHLESARRVDAIGGPVASWRAVLDEKTTPECRAAHGKNFEVENPPKIGYPGTTHPHCRCTAGPPIDGARTLL